MRRNGRASRRTTMRIARAVVGLLICAAGCDSANPPGIADIETIPDAGAQWLVVRDAAPPAAEQLLNAEAWASIEPDTDPFSEHRPSEVLCDPLAGWYPEEGHLEIDTGHCNYLSIEQPLVTPLASGDKLELDLLHFDLTAPEPARAVLAMRVDGEEIWTHETPIPADAQRFKSEIVIQEAHPKGARVMFHLRNHGQNSWRLLGLMRK